MSQRHWHLVYVSLVESPTHGKFEVKTHPGKWVERGVNYLQNKHFFLFSHKFHLANYTLHKYHLVHVTLHKYHLAT